MRGVRGRSRCSVGITSGPGQYGTPVLNEERTMEHEGEYLYLIGVGNLEDWESGRGSLYYIEDRQSKKALPVFTTPEKIEEYARTNLNSPGAHMSMLESLGAASTSAPLTDGRFSLFPLKPDMVARAAASIQADYMIRDPRPGADQEIIRLDD